MIERWPYHGVEFQVYDLTPEEAYRQSLRDYKTSRKGIIKCAIKRWLKKYRRRKNSNGRVI